MVQIFTFISTLIIGVISIQAQFDQRFGNRLPPPPPPPSAQYLGTIFNVNPASFNTIGNTNVNPMMNLMSNTKPASTNNNNNVYNAFNNNNVNNVNNNNNNVNSEGLVDEFGQCGGLDYEGPKTCRASLICVKRSKYYSQCLTSEAAASATAPPPQLIPQGGKCHGGNIRGTLACTTGTACFIQTENVHGECLTSCPPGWFCAKQTLPEWAPCGGDGYVGLTKCKEGLQCVAHSKWYHECRSECPEGWKC